MKGLEFSRVYIVGVEDAQFTPGERPSKQEIEEARRVLYVGMTRAKDRLVFTRAENRGGRPTGGTQFLDEMRLVPRKPPRGTPQINATVPSTKVTNYA
jgi:DNA helicase-2/ATP-dependent DNA helicase PcrA